MNREKINKALNSKDQYNIMEAIYWIGENQDTSFIDDLFILSFDPRVSHQREFLGMSVHQACMGAFERITHQTPPNKISYKVDTMNIIFYKNLLKKK